MGDSKINVTVSNENKYKSSSLNKSISKYNVVNKISNNNFTFIEKSSEFNGLNEQFEPHPEDFYVLSQLVDENSAHSACIGIKSIMTTGMGYRHDEEASEIANNILSEPNNDIADTFQEILNKTIKDYWINGNSTIGIKKVGDNYLVKHLNSSYIRAKVKKINNKSTTKVEKYYEADELGNFTSNTYYPLNRDTDIVNGKWYLVRMLEYTQRNRYYGLPIYLSGLYNIAENKIIYNYNKNFFDNNARPDYAIIVEGASLSDDQKTAIGDYLGTNLKGYENAHKTLFLDVNGTDVKIRLEKISGMDEGAFRLLRLDNRDEIIQSHLVPPKLIGVSSSGGLAGGNEAIGALKMLSETLVPTQIKLNNFINSVFKKIFNVELNFKLLSMNLINEKDQAVVYGILSKITDADGNPVYTVNEIRNELKKEIYTTDNYTVKVESKSGVNENGDYRDNNLDTKQGNKDNIYSTDIN